MWLALLVLLAYLKPANASATWFQPLRNTTSWQYQLSDSGSIKRVSGVNLYIIDMDTARTALPKLKAAQPSARVICYFSAGSYERYRADDDADRGANSIRAADWAGALGKPLAGWPDERWLDIRSARVRSVMARRMRFARSIGCDGVDPDNVDGYSTATGFPLVRADQVKYNAWLATTAHGLGLAVGLKNAVGLLPDLHPRFDFFINEECFAFQECSAYDVVNPTKPVLGVEYCDGAAELGSPTQDPACYCPQANARGWAFSVKRADLGWPGVSCKSYCRAHACGPAAATGSCRAKRPDVCAAALG